MLKKKRILQIIHSFDIEGPGGGASRFGVELARQLDPDRFESRIYALWWTGQNNEEKYIQMLENQGIKTFIGGLWKDQSPYKDFFIAVNRISRHLSTWHPDIIHSHSEFADMAVLYFKFKNRSLKIIRTVHNGSTLEWPKRPIRRWLLSYFLYPILFASEIGVSPRITNTLNRRTLTRLLRQRAHCIYNAIDLQRFQANKIDKPQKKQELDLPSESFVIGSIGRLAPEKGFDIFIQSIPEILAVYPHAYFLFVGSGPLDNSLRQMATSTGVIKQVRFLGARSDIDEILPCMDLFVSSSRWEGLPTTVLESMAVGIPIVASDIPGNRELVQDQITGWIVPSENPKELARGIIQAVQSINNGIEFSSEAKNFVQKFSIKASTTSYETLYQKVLDPSNFIASKNSTLLK